MFPKTLVSAAARTSSGNALTSVMEEEGTWAREANIARERAAAHRAAMRRLGRLNIYLAPGVAVPTLIFTTSLEHSLLTATSESASAAGKGGEFSGGRGGGVEGGGGTAD
ncbi:MAG: hypothetical protein ACM3ZO_01640 [Clostridia bacterium]